jgi:VanZ family protein
MGMAAVALGMALPLARHLYEHPAFLWASLASALVVGALLLLAPVRASTPRKRKLFFFGLAACLAGVQTLRLYYDYGAPSLWVATPQVLAFFRELVHIVEYGLLAFVASRLLQSEVGGPLLYLAALAYAFIVGIADESVQWLHAFRVGDLRDVLSNGMSACIGLLYRACLAPAPLARTTTGAKWLVPILLGMSPLLFVEFYLRTQTGHSICDGSQICFVSHYTVSELEAKAEDRVTRWAKLPFGSLVREEPRFWAWEDYFLTEARAHLRMANNGLVAGDQHSACAEIQILTTYFKPAVPVIGARPPDYACQSEVEGFRSQAFPQLDVEPRPARMRGTALALAIMLLVVGGLLSRPGSRRRQSA